jgi:hypothetical protein
MRTVIAALIVAAVSACHSDSTAPETKSILSVEAVTSTTLDGTAGQPVGQTPTVLVKDFAGHPVVGVPVDFSRHDGTVTSDTAVTDQSGTASPGQWILGDRAGQNTLSAVVGGVVRARFTATVHADRPASLSILSGNDEVQVAGVSITDVGVIARDKFRNNTPNVRVAFSLTGPGTLSSPAAETGPDGIARLGAWTLAPEGGVYTLVARTDGVDSVVITAHALDQKSLTWYRLESIAFGSNRYEPEVFYLQAAELALSPSGYYVEDVAWTYAVTHAGGPYTVSNSSITLNVSGDKGTIAGDSLLIDRIDTNDVGEPITWIYRLSNR